MCIYQEFLYIYIYIIGPPEWAVTELPLHRSHTSSDQFEESGAIVEEKVLLSSSLLLSSLELSDTKVYEP